jgi:ubiquinone/menaquinone biosynthesis C-methylase UbiE
VAEEATYAFGYDPGVQNYLRWHTVERSAQFLIPHLRSGMCLVDAGCGPGTITVGLAAIVAPGQVVAVDLNPGEVAKAARALRDAGYDNVRTEVASVLDLPLEDCSCDAVFSHLVLDYVHDPVAAMRELHRVLKPGGVIGLRCSNNDLNVIGPPNALVEEGSALFGRVVASKGGNLGRGRLLGTMLKEVGFERIFMSFSYEAAQSREEWQSYCNSIADAYDNTTITKVAIREGWADHNKIDQIVAAVRDFGTDTSNCLAYALGEAVAYKAG